MVGATVARRRGVPDGRLPAPWWIAGGWAIDLHAGRQTREHRDVDILLLRDDQLLIQAQLPFWEIQIAHGGRLEPWPARKRVAPPRGGFWARSDPGGPWQIQFLLADHESNEWIHKHDPSIRLRLGEIGLRGRDGIPFLRPELVLLFKSRRPRERDEQDLVTALPRLDRVARARLRAWLPLDHPWHGKLRESA